MGVSRIMIPKSLNFSTSSKHDKFSCSSRFSVSETPNKLMNFIELTLDDDISKLLSDLLNDQFPKQVLSLVVLLRDEDGKLRQEFDELIGKGSMEVDVKKKANIVLDEVVPHLLENADLWIFSRLMVSSNFEESFNKLRSEKMMGPSSLAVNSSKSIRCTKVFVDVSIVGVIDDEFKKIHSREELKKFLHHLMSMEGVTSAFAVCLKALASKEKMEALKEYSHATIW